MARSGLRAAQMPMPTVGPRDVLVRVSAASINPLDKMVRNGEFKLLLKYVVVTMSPSGN
jgi:NADPH:quinone reductase-like Zn-dependent oxidoreductase